MDDKSLMIRVLEWATKQESFTFQQLCESVEPNEKEKEQLKRLIHHKSLLFQNHVSFYSSVDKADIELFASAEDHFRYLEYVELKEARESAKDANKKSLVAIWIAVVSMFGSIGFSIGSMVSDINVPDKLYGAIQSTNQNVLNELVGIRKEQTELNDKLELIEVKNVCLINTDPTYK
ncbi:hypothetical protein [uncultured Pseudoalteromonas sp.]|uniref:hypothetical protein n=1 Tax=uncultured Pseudoalteromonas sp. TaxID=114053 RepID=UPI0030DB5FEE|tara:strand:+ start:14083 stop:14613 length:531 start_codon:yes stop_codon:yes gene_type:complete